MQEFDPSTVSLGDAASWHDGVGVFRIRVHGNRDFVSLVIVKNAPLPIGHLKAEEHDMQTKLGPHLRDLLEQAVNAAIARGARHVLQGAALLGPEEAARLTTHPSGSTPASK
jgi:hypothetical protein